MVFLFFAMFCVKTLWKFHCKYLRVGATHSRSGITRRVEQLPREASEVLCLQCTGQSNPPPCKGTATGERLEGLSYSGQGAHLGVSGSADS